MSEQEFVNEVAEMLGISPDKIATMPLEGNRHGLLIGSELAFVDMPFSQDQVMTAACYLMRGADAHQS